MTDQELLNDYARNGSEAAFAELVRRHVDLVYSAGVRIARDCTLAEDITQNVFIALAKGANHLTDHPVLAGWLHQTTRNIAANTIRSAARRQVYEYEAATMNQLLIANDDSWENIAPQLDEALASLPDPDRDAILLRYFQRKTAHEMAVALGISDEAAQKRVNRAVERLRESLSRRNIGIGAAALALAISTNAVRSAPAVFASGLAASVVTSVVVVKSSTAVVAGNVFASSTLAKAILAFALVAAVGAGLYGARLLTHVRNPGLVALADAGPKSGLASQAQPNPSSNSPTVNATEFKIRQWTGRKRAHEPTLAEAEEDLTNALVQLGPDADRTPDVWVQRGELQARTGNWNEAVTNIRQALVVDPADAWAGYLLSSALLASGDLAQYQKHSHAMMVTFGNTDDPIVGGRTSEAYLVAPYGENTDLEMSVALLERKRFYWWREFYEGLAQYRLGNFSAAADFLEKDISKLPSVNQIDGPPCEADCYLVLAMARRQLSQSAEAAAALTHGREVAETQMPQPGAPDLGPYWWNGVTTRALLKEANETVEQWSANPANASFTFSLAREAGNAAPRAKAVIPLTGPYSEPPAGPLHIVSESVTVNNGQMQFTVAGITPGATVCVLASGELFTPSSWVPISTNIAGSKTLTVNVPATNAHEFFRILETR